MENESLAKTRFLIIINKNTDGNRDNKINHVPKHLSIESIWRGSYRTFQATPSFGVEVDAT